MAASSGAVLFQLGAQTSDDSDVWDDTALIEAYDKAIGLAKEEVARRMGLEVPLEAKKKAETNKQEPKQDFKWKVGAPCQARFSEDGIFYEATIKDIYGDGKTCLVRFLGYNNEEEVSIRALRQSQGKNARKAQKTRAKAETDDENQSPPAVQKESRKSTTHTSHAVGKKAKQHKRDHAAWLPPMPPISSHHLPYMPPLPNQFPAPIAQLPWNSHHMPAPPPPPPPPPIEDNLEMDSEALNAMLMSWYMSGYHTGFYHGLRQSQRKLPPPGQATSSYHHHDIAKEAASSSTQDSS